MLLTLQNGLGNEEFLAHHFGTERVLGGLCFVCLVRVSPGLIDHYDVGRLVVGEYSGYPQARTHDIAWEFKRCGVVTTVAENLERERWRKLVWNIPFNGLALTAGGLDTSAILRNDELRLTALALMDEVIAGANKCGYAIPSAEALEQMKRTATLGAFKPSTLIDFEAGTSARNRGDLGRAVATRDCCGSENAAPVGFVFRTQSVGQSGSARSVVKDSPSITVRNAQRRIRMDREALEEFCGRGLSEVRRLPKRKAGVLQTLGEVTVVLVSDRRMAAIHQQFLKTAGPTDVITFQDGDIFVSVETAKRNARQFGTSLRDEIRLYVVHGLLHLHGFDDTTPAKSRAMNSIQRRIFDRLSTTRKAVRRV